MPKINHNGPAGRMYASIREAGEFTLAMFCEKYPRSSCRSSFILPILFKSDHPENVDQNVDKLSVSDKREHIGLNINIRGERGEYEVYKVFYSLIRQSPTESILVLHGFKLDNDNGRGMKKHAIVKELPTINLCGVNMRREHDFVVVVRDLGIVLCEVKSSSSNENIINAEAQLRNSEAFVQQVMAAIAPPTSAMLPIVKMILVPHEKVQPSPTTKYNDCHVVFADILQNFETKWCEVVNELRSMVDNCIDKARFAEFVQFIVGVWTMRPVTKSTCDFDNSDASLSPTLEKVDAMVYMADFATTKQARKFTSDIATSLNDVFHRVEDFNIIYLSPDQKKLFDKYNHALIHAHAGTGKTMLIIFKIIEILESDPTQKVILIAPPPHHIRCQQIFIKHGFKTEVITDFPYKRKVLPTQALPRPTCDVLIMTIRDFFKSPGTYDVSGFNIFTDDLHSHKVPTGRNVCTYVDIGDFIDSTYHTLKDTEQVAWFAFDVTQGAYHRATNRKPDQLFVAQSGAKRKFAIPVVTLTNVLRNAKEVSDVLDTARNSQVDFLDLYTNDVIKNITCGHNITTGEQVLYEKLKQNTDNKHWKAFVCDRLCTLLRSLSTPITPLQSDIFPFSSIAVLFQYVSDLNEYKPAIMEMLHKDFNSGVQSIEEQLMNNKKMDLILDHCDNAMSFECATVVYVRTEGCSNAILYNAISRGRTKCIVLDVKVSSPPLPLKYIDVVVWEEVNGAFQKLQ